MGAKYLVTVRRIFTVDTHNTPLLKHTFSIEDSQNTCYWEQERVQFSEMYPELVKPSHGFPLLWLDVVLLFTLGKQKRWNHPKIIMHIR